MRCEECDEEIPIARLRAAAGSRLCRRCKQRFERLGKYRPHPAQKVERISPDRPMLSDENRTRLIELTPGKGLVHRRPRWPLDAELKRKLRSDLTLRRDLEICEKVDKLRDRIKRKEIQPPGNLYRVIDFERSAMRRIEAAISKALNREAQVLRAQLKEINSRLKGREVRLRVRSRKRELVFYCESTDPPAIP